MKIRTLIYISAITTPILILIMFLHGSPLKVPEATPRGIIDLEMAGTLARASEIYNAWKPDLVNRAIKNTYIDFLFIISYTTFLFATCRFIAKASSQTYRKVGFIISNFMIVAGVFDCLENVLMFSTLSMHFKKEIVAATYIFASIKFSLVGFGLLYLLVSLFARLFTVKKKLIRQYD